mmetsp:Transcript_30033/g.69282  ORF Transcript_30033/g.69282 Transcript_30033/m.69282 type:complete len:331 (-) Transcript_30033:9-1001(-)
MEWFSLDSRAQFRCDCGETLDEACTFHGFRNHNQFPPFHHLPFIEDPDVDYFRQDPYTGIFYPRRHWALVGTIEKVEFFIRPRASIVTNFAERVLVNFHLESALCPDGFGWDELKVGSSMVILYAERKTFLDMSVGIRQESPETVMVFPVSLPDLNKNYEAIQAHVNRSSSSSSSARRCFACGEEETVGLKTKRCGACKVAQYCGRDCQISHWKESHKQLCPYFRMLAWLACIDFSTFRQFVAWNVYLDQHRANMDKLFGRFGGSYEGSFEEDSDSGNSSLSEDDNGVKCSACGKVRAADSYTKNQHKKNSKKIRCKKCVRLGRPSLELG